MGHADFVAVGKAERHALAGPLFGFANDVPLVPQISHWLLHGIEYVLVEVRH